MELAMHLNPLSGEASEGANQALVFLSIPSLLVRRKEGSILDWRVSESLRGVAPLWTLGAPLFIPLNPCFSPLDLLCLSFVSHQHPLLTACSAGCVLAELCWAFTSGSPLHWHIGMGGWSAWLGQEGKQGTLVQRPP